MLRQTLTTLATIALASSAQTQTVFNRTVELDHTAVMAHQDQDIYIVIKLDTPDDSRFRTRRRTPLNIGLVIDRSGSMAEKGKMEYAREAAKFIVDNLGAEDRLSITEYDNHVNVVWPSSIMTSKATVKRIIDRIHPRGGTNLCGGMRGGIDETKQFIREEKLNRVILLSDGLANQGITDRNAIYRFARDARSAGITLSTIGLGLEYDEDLMQGIAESAGGRYYYVESPAQMESIFREELSSLSATLVQNINIQFKHSDCISTVKVYGYQSTSGNGSTSIPLSPFYAGESRSVLLKVRTSKLGEGTKKLGTLTYTWTDAETNAPHSETASLAVSVTSDRTVVASSANKPVVAEATLIEAEEEHDRNVRLFEQGQEQKARENMAALNSRLARVNSTLSDKRIRSKMEAVSLESQDMLVAAQAPAAKSAYVKQRKQELYYAQKGQRSKYVLESGNSGSDVMKLQEALKSRNLYTGSVDGNFSAELELAVKSFQMANSLTADGVAGPETLRKLDLY